MSMPSRWFGFFSVMMGRGRSQGIVMQPLHVMREINIRFDKFTACIDAFIGMFFALKRLRKPLFYPRSYGVCDLPYKRIDRAFL